MKRNAETTGCLRGGNFQLGEEWLDPFKQRPATGVADAQPDDDGAGRGLPHAVWKILVLASGHGRFFGISRRWREVGAARPPRPT